MGMKDNLHNLLRRLTVAIIAWLVISTVLVNLLFVYFEHYIRKEDAKVYYEVGKLINAEEHQIIRLNLK